MDTLTLEQQREDFVCENTKRIFGELKAKLRAGDQAIAMLVDEFVGAKLYGSFDNDKLVAQYHIDMANGVNRWQQMADAALQAEAETRALALADEVEQERDSMAVEMSFDLHKLIASQMAGSGVFRG